MPELPFIIAAAEATATGKRKRSYRRPWKRGGDADAKAIVRAQEKRERRAERLRGRQTQGGNHE